jgi:hypothetical protein
MGHHRGDKKQSRNRSHLRGTEGSNLVPSSGESLANLTFSIVVGQRQQFAGHHDRLVPLIEAVDVSKRFAVGKNEPGDDGHRAPVQLTPRGKTKILDTPDEAAKIEIGVPQRSEFVFHQKDFLDFFVVCFIYDDERGHHSEPTFYAMQAPEWKGGVRPVTSAQYQALASGFSCTKLEK